MKTLLLGGELASAISESKVIRGLQEGNAETCCCPAIIGLEVSWGIKVSNLVYQTGTDGYETKNN